MKEFKGIVKTKDGIRIEVSTSKYTGQFMELSLSEAEKLKNELNKSLV